MITSPITVPTMGLRFGAFLSRHWEWMLIAALLAATWAMNRHMQELGNNARLAEKVAETASNDRDQAVAAAGQSAALARSRLEELRQQQLRTEAALAERERTIHALQSQTAAAVVVVATAPDDGCLDSDIPADLLRQLWIATGSDGSGSPVATSAAAANPGAAATAALSGPDLASPVDLRASAPRDGPGVGDGQESRHDPTSEQ